MKIAILGTSVAGLSTSIALSNRVRGVEVYESNPVAKYIGAEVVFWLNASVVPSQLVRSAMLSKSLDMCGKGNAYPVRKPNYLAYLPIGW